jgi:hypothetical protein
VTLTVVADDGRTRLECREGNNLGAISGRGVPAAGVVEDSC